jgi:hypothetical protein
MRRPGRQLTATEALSEETAARPRTCYAFEYPLPSYPFPRLVAEALGLRDLSMLHLDSRRPRSDRTVDQDSHFHRAYYARATRRLLPVYRCFLFNAIRPLFPVDLVVQATPTLRIHCPRDPAINSFHTDSAFNHQDGTVNFWVPLTRAFGTNSLWLDLVPENQGHQPVDLDVGRVLRLDALRIRHGTLPNETASTRVSFDFRVIPRRMFRNLDAETVAARKPMRLGHYYDLLESHHACDNCPTE